MRRGRKMVMWVSKMKTRETGDWVYSCIGERGRFPDVCLVHLSVSVCHQNSEVWRRDRFNGESSSLAVDGCLWDMGVDNWRWGFGAWGEDWDRARE